MSQNFARNLIMVCFFMNRNFQVYKFEGQLMTLDDFITNGCLTIMHLISPKLIILITNHLV